MSVAEELRRHPALVEEVRVLLDVQRGAFLLGNIAPDVHMTSGQSRQSTHFFALPLHRDSSHPWDLMLTRNPSLMPRIHLSQEQIAFIVGYLCHLQADWLWVLDIFLPIFGSQCGWDTFKHRLYLHDVLRAYLDKQILSGLSPDIPRILGEVEPHKWVPFIEDLHLVEWRDYLSDQLAPGAIALTVEVFAIRHRIPPDQYHHLIRSERLMDNEIFIHLPRRRLQEYREKLLEMNLCLLNDYMAHRKKPVIWSQDGILDFT